MVEHIDYVLKDTRNCRSNNLQKFFGRKNNRNFYDSVIRCDGRYYFACTQSMPHFWVGAKVIEVACYGAKAGCAEWFNLRGKPIEDVTQWFWSKYKELGMYSIPEVWSNKSIPPVLSHSEAHTI